jgi:hypothetical protein
MEGSFTDAKLIEGDVAGVTIDEGLWLTLTAGILLKTSLSSEDLDFIQRRATKNPKIVPGIATNAVITYVSTSMGMRRFLIF